MGGRGSSTRHQEAAKEAGAMADGPPPPHPVPPPRPRQNFEFKRTYLRPSATIQPRGGPHPPPTTMGPPLPVPIKKRSSWRVSSRIRSSATSHSDHNMDNHMNGEGLSDDEASPNGVSGHSTCPVDSSSPSVAPGLSAHMDNNMNGEGHSDDEASPNGVSGHSTSPVDSLSPSVAPAPSGHMDNNMNGEGPSDDDEASPNGVSGHSTTPVDSSSPSVVAPGLSGHTQQGALTKVRAPPPGRDGRDPLSHLLAAAGRVRSQRSPKGPGQPKASKKKPVAKVCNSKRKLEHIPVPVPAHAMVAGTPGACTVRWQAVGGPVNYMRPVLPALEYAEDEHKTDSSKRK